MEKTRPIVSWLGIPFGSSRNCLNQSALSYAKSTISTHPWHPERVPQTARTIISFRLCLRRRFIRGSFIKENDSVRLTFFIPTSLHEVEISVHANCFLSRSSGPKSLKYQNVNLNFNAIALCVRTFFPSFSLWDVEQVPKQSPGGCTALNFLDTQI